MMLQGEIPDWNKTHYQIPLPQTTNNLYSYLLEYVQDKYFGYNTRSCGCNGARQK